MGEGTGTTIGQSVSIKGELSAKEDLTIEGQVEGKIELDQNAVTIGPNGRIKAQVKAKVVSVLGRVNGNITATETLNIGEKGSVEGDLRAPRVGIAEGSHFKGRIDMQQSKAPKVSAGTRGQIPQPLVATPR